MTGYAGVELWTYDAALALARAGHQVSVQSERWEYHYEQPLRAAGVECRDHENFPDGIAVNFAPKAASYKAACVTGRPVIQVLHSEHLTDVPMRSPVPPAGLVLIRAGQRWLIDAEDWACDIPRRLIRNPIDFGRFGPGDDPLALRSFACVMLSEFDDMKAELAEAVQQRVGGEVLLVGPWRSELPVPPKCTHEQPTLEVRQAYARARMAFSYRLSRQFAEGMACRIPVLVRGELEPAQVTRHDQDDVWSVHDPLTDPDGLALALQFDADHVASQLVEFAQEVLGR